MLKDQILLKFEERNKNGRIYSKTDITEIRKKDYVKWDEKGFYEIHYNLIEALNGSSKKVYIVGDTAEEIIYNHRQHIFGEIGHPDSLEITLNKISHRIENFKISGIDLLADVQILSTNEGENLKKLKELGVDLAFSMRSVGTVSEEGIVSIEKIITFDAIDKKDWAYDS